MSQMKVSDNKREGKAKVPHNRRPGGSFAMKRLGKRRQRRQGKQRLKEWQRRATRTTTTVGERGVTVSDVSPGWGHGRPPGGAYWTQQRVADALRRYIAENRKWQQLPTSSHEWSVIKRGRYDLPTAEAVLEHWGAMAAAWLAAGVPRWRLPMTNSRWSEEDMNFLQENAGEMSLTDIARHLNRSYAAIKTRLGSKGLKLKARENAGYMSANAVAREYGVDVRYVHACIKNGLLPATARPYGRCYMIEPEDAERVFGRGS